MGNLFTQQQFFFLQIEREGGRPEKEVVLENVCSIERIFPVLAVRRKKKNWLIKVQINLIKSQELVRQSAFSQFFIMIDLYLRSKNKIYTVQFKSQYYN